MEIREATLTRIAHRTYTDKEGKEQSIPEYTFKNLHEELTTAIVGTLKKECADRMAGQLEINMDYNVRFRPDVSSDKDNTRDYQRIIIFDVEPCTF